MGSSVSPFLNYSAHQGRMEFLNTLLPKSSMRLPYV